MILIFLIFRQNTLTIFKVILHTNRQTDTTDNITISPELAEVTIEFVSKRTKFNRFIGSVRGQIALSIIFVMHNIKI